MTVSHCIVPPSLDSARAPAAFRHAGGMKAISRRLSAATPPEPHANQIASQRDASIHGQRCRTLGPLAGIPSGCDPFGAYPAVVSLRSTHRLVSSLRCLRPPILLSRLYGYETPRESPETLAPDLWPMPCPGSRAILRAGASCAAYFFFAVVEPSSFVRSTKSPRRLRVSCLTGS